MGPTKYNNGCDTFLFWIALMLYLMVELIYYLVFWMESAGDLLHQVERGLSSGYMKVRACLLRNVDSSSIFCYAFLNTIFYMLSFYNQ